MGISNYTNQFITTYAQINDKLIKTTKEYIDKTTDSPTNFINRQKRESYNLRLENRLINAPKGNINKIIEEQYKIKNPKEEPLGTIEIDEQVEGIKKITLLMLMANRVAKTYKHLIKNDDSIDEKQHKLYDKKSREYLVAKDQATSDLLSCLYVLKNDNQNKYKNYFNYGFCKDIEGKENLVIDVPEYGQISVHFGRMKDVILQEAMQKTFSILDVKKEKGQLSNDQYAKLQNEITNDSILPKYKELLYETSSAIPLKNIDENIINLTKKLKIYKKDPSTINSDDIKEMIKEGLNVREARYLCLKLGAPKTQLEEVAKVYTERNVIRNALRQTNAQERSNIRIKINSNLLKQKEKNNKPIGGR